MIVPRDQFIENYDAYPIFRFVPKGEKNMLTYQYSSKNKDTFSEVEDLVTYRGQCKQGFHHWISNVNIENRGPTPKSFDIPKKVGVEPGDVVKIKYRGMKQKFRVLGATDVITDGCIQQMVYDVHSEQAKRLTVDQYNEFTLAKFMQQGRWDPAQCIGEQVCDSHLHRIYLEKI